MVAVDWFVVNILWIRRQDADQEVTEERRLVIPDSLLYVML